MTRILGTAFILLGVIAGLVLAELMFAWRDDHAFPHVNFYLADAALGTRLAAHARMRIAFGGNPATEIHTNDRGFRGSDWSAPGKRDVLVVGDSQVFGLGVKDTDTFSAQLERMLGAGTHVLNAGVPTYGPLEYTSLVERFVRERKPESVIYVLNMANDLFEVEHPNKARHVVWDGWAVRKETAPKSVLQFPGRAWLMTQSHLVFALRSLLHAGAIEDARFASEGTWQELLKTATSIPPSKTPAAVVLDGASPERAHTIDELEGIQTQLVYHFADQLKASPQYGAVAKKFARYEGNARDILARTNAEESRPINETAYQLLFAALALDQNGDALRALAGPAADEQTLLLLDRRAALRAKLASLGQDNAALARSPRPIDDVLARTMRVCQAVDARLFVVALPLDVQVSKAEWKKYEQAAIDLTPTRVLLDDVVTRAEAVGATGVDATRALAAAEPGAFLARDLHMSAKGHAALARALYTALIDRTAPRLVIPRSRSVLPAWVEWAAVAALEAPSLATQHCQAQAVREWVQVRCDERELARSRLTLERGGRGEAIASADYAAAAAIFPLLPGDEVRVRFSWQKPTEESEQSELRAVRGEGSQLTLSMRAVAAEDPPRSHGVFPESIEGWLNRSGYDDRSCSRAFGEHCPITYGPRACPDGQIPFGMIARCVPRCSVADECKSKHCAVWNGQRGCIEP